MILVGRYLRREIVVAVSFVLLGFLALFAFFDFINELEDVGRGGYKLQQRVDWTQPALRGIGAQHVAAKPAAAGTSTGTPASDGAPGGAPDAAPATPAPGHHTGSSWASGTERSTTRWARTAFSSSAATLASVIATVRDSPVGEPRCLGVSVM